LPAKSKKQQKLMGAVYAYKKGKNKHASKKVKEIAKGMSKKSAKDFASTKHKKLPEKVKSESCEPIKLKELVEGESKDE
jgi:hypothetical protein